MTAFDMVALQFRWFERRGDPCGRPGSWLFRQSQGDHKGRPIGIKLSGVGQRE